MAPRNDLEGEKDLWVTPTWDSNKLLISSNKPARRRDLLVREFTCTLPEDIGPGNIAALEAAEARYVPPVPGKKRTGGWLLTNTRPAELERWNRLDVLEPIAPGKYFLYTNEVDFDVATRDRKWFYRASTVRLIQELGKAEPNRVASMAVVFHMRLTRPILGMVLVFLGLSVILRDQNRNVFISAGLCLGLCALFFGVCFGCKHLGEKEFISPALSAWLPVLLFGPLSFSMFDAIHT
jgi:lipopolysaccharide export system permease protein